LIFLAFFAETGRSAAHKKSADDVRVCAVSMCTVGVAVAVLNTKLVHRLIRVTLELAWTATGLLGDRILIDGRCWRVWLESLGLECLGDAGLAFCSWSCHVAAVILVVDTENFLPKSSPTKNHRTLGVRWYA
jgi:hypothetical protein